MILIPQCCASYADLLWGKQASSLVGQSLARLVEVPGPGGAAGLLFLDDGRKNGGIKPAQSAAAARVGPVRQITAHHADTAALRLSAQAVGKQGSR